MKKFILFLFFVGFAISHGNSEPVAIVVSNNQSPVEKTAADQLQKYLSKIYPGDEFTIVRELPSDKRKAILIGSIQKLTKYKALLPKSLPEKPESYSIAVSHHQKKGGRRYYRLRRCRNVIRSLCAS